MHDFEDNIDYYYPLLLNPVTMPSIKNPKQGDVYLSAHDISKKLDISVSYIYGMRNLDKIRWIFNTANFNLDDVRKYVKEKEAGSPYKSK